MPPKLNDRARKQHNIQEISEDVLFSKIQILGYHPKWDHRARKQDKIQEDDVDISNSMTSKMIIVIKKHAERQEQR